MPSLTPLRKRLALPRTSWQLCLLAIIGGSASALLIVLFLLSIKAIQQLYNIERHNYSSLDALSRFDLPILGALIILLFAWLTGYKYLRTGIPFVLHRLKVAHGVIPLKNTLNQFWGSAVALASGFSVGKEGPAVHLGAACSSYIGSQLRLPFNSIRTLCACGIAAGIAATFNTPVAAVIFVMEVILRDYKVHIFIPVMLAAIMGSLITSSVFGPAHEFEFLQKIALEIQHYPYLVILGIVLGVLAYLFNRYLILIIKHSAKLHIVTRLMVAALITGALGYFIPFAMGSGLSSLDFSLAHQWQLELLLTLLVAKFLMTIFALGLGIPGGIIGPVVTIGAIAGICISSVVTQFFPAEHLGSDFALMGMAGLLAATLNAPLTALLTVMELSHQIEIIVPAMIVITTASLVSGQLFKNQSIFIQQLDIQALTYRKQPIESSLQKIGVLALLKENFSLQRALSKKEIDQLFIDDTELMLIIKKEINNKNKDKTVIPPEYYWVESYSSANNLNNEYQHKTIHHKLTAMSCQSTLDQAYTILVNKRSGGVYIYDKTPDDIMGFITFEQIRLYLVEGKLNS
jgi:H+/Cl- antiporter ClcA